MGEEDKQGNADGEEKRRPISEAEFLSWKRRKAVVSRPTDHQNYPICPIPQDANISSRRDEAARKRAEEIAAGTVQMNGRELFVHEPWVFDNTLY